MLVSGRVRVVFFPFSSYKRHLQIPSSKLLTSIAALTKIKLSASAFPLFQGSWNWIYHWNPSLTPRPTRDYHMSGSTPPHWHDTCTVMVWSDFMCRISHSNTAQVSRLYRCFPTKNQHRSTINQQVSPPLRLNFNAIVVGCQKLFLSSTTIPRHPAADILPNKGMKLTNHSPILWVLPLAVELLKLLLI